MAAENPYDATSKTQVAGVNIWKATSRARLMRELWRRGQMPQAEFMTTHWEHGKAKGTRKSEHKSSFQNNFGSFTNRSGKPSFERPIRQVPVPADTNYYGKPRMLEWAGPSVDEWLAAMNNAELDKAFTEMEKTMLETGDEHDGWWLTRIRQEINSRGGTELERNPGEVGEDESLDMAAGRHYAQEWTVLGFKVDPGYDPIFSREYPTPYQWKGDPSEAMEEATVVSDALESGNRNEAILVAKRITIIPGSVVHAYRRALAEWKAAEAVLVGLSGIYATVPPDGPIAGVRWLRSNYPSDVVSATVEEVEMGWNPHYVVMDYLEGNGGDREKLMLFAKENSWREPRGKIRRAKHTEGRGATVLWYAEINDHVNEDDFLLGFMLGVAAWWSKNRVSLMRGRELDAVSLKKNPGERRDDESLNMKAGRFMATTISDYGMTMSEIKSMSPIVDDLEVMSDAIETGDREAAFAMIEAINADDLPVNPEIPIEQAARIWDGAVRIVARQGQIVRIAPSAEDYEEVRAFVNRHARGAWGLLNYRTGDGESWRRAKSVIDDRGERFLEATVDVGEDPLRASYWYMDLPPDPGRSTDGGDFVLGWWMEILLMIRKLTKKPRANPHSMEPMPIELDQESVLRADRAAADDIREVSRVWKGTPSIQGGEAPHGWTKENIEAVFIIGDAIDEGRKDDAFRVGETLSMFGVNAFDHDFGIRATDVIYVDFVVAYWAHIYTVLRESTWGQRVVAFILKGEPSGDFGSHHRTWPQKANPSSSDDEYQRAIVRNNEMRRTLADLKHKAAAISMSPMDARKRELAARKISAVERQLESHSNLVADLEASLKLNPSASGNPDREEAVEMYKQFWRLEPKSIGEFDPSFKIPERVSMAGSAIWITYRSGKKDPETLKKPKREVDYIHHFDPGVQLYSVGGSAGESVPGWLREVTSLTLLGTCLGWEMKSGDKKREAKATKPMPELYTIPSGRALLVIQDKREILAIFYGGDLGVEGRGIVH